MSIGIRETANKFAFLHVQDSSDDDDWSQVPTRQPANITEKTVPVPEEKKKSRRRRKKNSSSYSDDPNALDRADAQLRDWVERDRDFVENKYDEDLRSAIELSKVEFEKEELHKSDVNTVTIIHPKPESRSDPIQGNCSVTKKIKKKKSKTLSLEEFQQQVEGSLPLPPSPSTLNSNKSGEKKRPDVRNEPDFFDRVDKAVNDIKRSEAAKLRFQNPHHAKDREVENMKDELIDKLRNEVKDLESKFKQVKKRNKQLLIMLQQGEMKDKSDLLLENERLNALSSELTLEVTALNQSLEQERSRSRKYKDELLKIQGTVQEDAGF